MPEPFSLYVHVPYCTVRCGYCDFNTYTASELGGGASRASYAAQAIAEIGLAAAHLRAAGREPARVETVFFGGGTPTILPASDLAAMLEAARQEWSLAPGAEVTTEANPETVGPAELGELRAAGINRISIGMQSAVPHVLATLDRVHTPGRALDVVGWARQAGFEQISLDLIYGTPGETLDDWRRSVEAAVAMGPDHISAYALVVEEGTRMGAQVARGELPTPDPDDEADKYELADELLSEAGFRWYEISNFARVEAGEEDLVATRLRHASRHNLAYWRDWDWWGLGPGAHSHVGRQRWWNVKHPRAYAGRVRAGTSPAAAGEVLGTDTRELERVLLAVRTAEGVHLGPLDDRSGVAGLVEDGLVEPDPAREGHIVLTLRGRLLADLVTRTLTG